MLLLTPQLPLDPTTYRAVRVDQTSSAIYVGLVRSDAVSESETAPVWRIHRQSLSGGVASLVYANGGAYISKWSERSSYFPTPAFVNAYSTRFDGVGDYAQCLPGSFGFERTNAFTVSLWLRPNTLAGNTAILSTFATGTRGLEIGITSATPLRPRFSLQSGGANKIVVETTANVLSTLTWHHVVFVYDGSSTAAGVTCYINGVATTLTVVTNNLTGTSVSTNPLLLGTQDVNNANKYDGHMDEVSIWTDNLSASEVGELRSSGEPTDLSLTSIFSSCLSWWRMGDGATWPVIPDERGYATCLLINILSTQIETQVP